MPGREPVRRSGAAHRGGTGSEERSRALQMLDGQSKFVYYLIMTIDDRPFTGLVNRLRTERGYRYSDLVNKSGEARSSAWFNNLVNAPDPWAVTPPDPDAWPGLMSLFGITEDHLREAIAEEWFRVRRNEVPSIQPDVLNVIASLDEGDIGLIRSLAERLKRP